jgi:hypothetical protein
MGARWIDQSAISGPERRGLRMKALYGRRGAALSTGLAVVLIACVFVPASLADPPGTFAAPGLRVTPPQLEFGAVALGQTRERTVTITNVGTEAAVFSIMGPSTGFPIFNWNFTSFLETCPLMGGVFLSPGEMCTFTVTAQPPTSSEPGTYEGTFRIGDLATGQAHVLVPLAVRAKQADP